jgi:DNA repair protein RadA/Sms
MSKSDLVYVCQSCGKSYQKWQGRCEGCGEWNTLAEEVKKETASESGGKRGKMRAGANLKNADLSEYLVNFDQSLKQTKMSRFSTKIGELDRVLGSDQTGSGMVLGGVVLIGGEPGIGKSTLLSEMLIRMNSEDKNCSILYIAGEESPNQIGLRLNRMLEKRMAQKTAGMAALTFVTTTDTDEIAELLEREKPNMMIVDSIQTLTTRDLLGPAGSLGQVREAAERITVAAKKNNVATMMVGHVNKDGEIAGPKTLEHIVDAVLELSGERGEEWRFLRAVKNRFGATDEVGVFQMTEEGMREITNPSELFLEEMTERTAGTGVVAIMEGTRPLLIQVQALVVDSQLAMPRRVGRGVDLPRIQVLCAILQKQLRLPIGMNDVFLSVVGGMSVRESAIELGLAMVMVSSQVNKPLPERAVFIGEVGLMGEIRKVSNLERRIKEAKRLGYERVYSRLTHANLRSLVKDLGLA